MAAADLGLAVGGTGVSAGVGTVVAAGAASGVEAPVRRFEVSGSPGRAVPGGGTAGADVAVGLAGAGVTASGITEDTAGVTVGASAGRLGTHPIATSQARANPVKAYRINR